MNVVLISTYELGRQPFGLASPAAWLKAAGAIVTCFDLALQQLDEERIASADLVAFYVPMHTATRLACTLVGLVKLINPHTHICFYGLYASVNEHYLRKLGAHTILGGEFESGLVALFQTLSGKKLPVDNLTANRPDVQSESVVSLKRQNFLIPDRSGLPALQKYAHLDLGNGVVRTVGYTEATRGCKHLCRHCPIPPVYGGKFRVVQPEVVLEDIRRQVDVGAEHITFGDPDFFNGPGHALRIVKALHDEFSDLTYDVTIKIEHLLKHSQHLATLRDTGCVFVTSAVESVDNYVLKLFDKHHTKEDFIQVVSMLRQVGLKLNPTFVTFTPWTSLNGYLDLLTLLFELELVENVAPIQYAIRLLIPQGSRLLELAAVQKLLGKFDETALCYRWDHPDQRVDQLYEAVLQTVKVGQANNETRSVIFGHVWKLAQQANADSAVKYLIGRTLASKTVMEPIPHLSEPWYC